jgi:hypothetical protein
MRVSLRRNADFRNLRDLRILPMIERLIRRSSPNGGCSDGVE